MKKPLVNTYFRLWNGRYMNVILFCAGEYRRWFDFHYANHGWVSCQITLFKQHFAFYIGRK